MQRAALLRSLKPRLNPGRWGLLVAFLGLLGLLRILFGDPPAPQEWPHFLRGLLLIVSLVVLAPMPWQWTGDGRPLAPLWRGALQALLWNLLWLGLLMALFAVLRARPPYFHALPKDPEVTALIRHLHHRSGLPGFLIPLVGLLPISLLVGWFIAALQGAEAERAEAVAAKEALEGTAREAQAQALKAQLDPHVLYNALSGITELVHENPAQAEEALACLGDLYRRLTVLGARDRIALGEERGLLEHYLAVEQLRLGSRLRIHWEWPEPLDRRTMPPLLLQPLVENAVKHGLAPLKAGGELRIAAAEEGAGLRFTVSNNGEPLPESWTEGMGLSNLAARLGLMGHGSGLALGRRSARRGRPLPGYPHARPQRAGGDAKPRSGASHRLRHRPSRTRGGGLRRSRRGLPPQALHRPAAGALPRPPAGPPRGTSRDEAQAHPLPREGGRRPRLPGALQDHPLRSGG